MLKRHDFSEIFVHISIAVSAKLVQLHAFLFVVKKVEKAMQENEAANRMAFNQELQEAYHPSLD